MLLLSTFDLNILYDWDCNQEKDFARESARVSSYSSHINILNSQHMNIGYNAIIFFRFRQNNQSNADWVYRARLDFVSSGNRYQYFLCKFILYSYGFDILFVCYRFKFGTWSFMVVFCFSPGSGQIAINMAYSVIFITCNSSTNVGNNLIFNFITIHYHYKL